MSPNQGMLVPREIRDKGTGVTPLETRQSHPVGERVKTVKSHPTKGQPPGRHETKTRLKMNKTTNPSGRIRFAIISLAISFVTVARCEARSLSLEGVGISIRAADKAYSYKDDHLNTTSFGGGLIFPNTPVPAPATTAMEYALMISDRQIRIRELGI